MWDSLGTSVDISLDKLSPYSRGLKVTTNNVPMNAMITQAQMQSGGSANQATKPIGGFASPPMSPVNSNSSKQTTPSTSKEFNFNK
jgi:hypothetical protein